MKKTNLIVALGLMTMTAMPAIAQSTERALSQSEIDDLISRSGVVGQNVDVQYLGGSQTAIETELCCENVEERIEQRTEVQETTTFFDAVTQREVIQPVERTLIQPVEREVIQARTETITEDTQFVEERLPVRVERQPAPQVVENFIPQERTETREEVTETFFDAVTARTIIQPIERTTIVPVQRRITRPVVDTVTAETRFETVTAPVRVEREPVPAVIETFTPQVSEVVQEEYTEVFVDAVTQRDIIQPTVRTLIQPVEVQLPRPRTETITADTQFVEERLPVRVEREPVPAPLENVQTQLIENVVYEVEDVYIDQVTRNVIQPVMVTTIQPVEYQRVQGRSETVTAPVQFETQRLPMRREAAQVPSAAVNFIPQERVENREERFETFYDTVGQRDIIQPIVRTLIQPVEIQRVSGRTETVTAPTQFETRRADLVVLNVGGPCNCAY